MRCDTPSVIAIEVDKHEEVRPNHNLILTKVADYKWYRLPKPTQTYRPHTR